MELKSKQERDIEKINKFTGYQLSNKFKIIGLGLSIISLVSIVMNAAYLENTKYYYLFDRIALTTMVLGFLVISLSKEKIEDELIAQIRMQSFNYAVIGTVIIYLTMPFINYILYFKSLVGREIEGSKDVAVLGLLLTIQILTFRKLKKAYNEE
ncbi:hypothetical protein SAMN05444395_101637 [Flavobacterium fryxellicola]|uniref:Uncharacterized protein n=1 Tax=Flavobacterium fryxellicola TaxID=249352 RepID=A0A168AE64_9FLAO|nr:hypothetical protein [Flavobacterium fryxellicola]OAB31389.1 hypothetical protein FBFR_00710 [Flavobacterium fryxellicola]SHN54267.1 hypothetical protein SAMN05444395_101637 [Flavobacterium fryxellicola]